MDQVVFEMKRIFFIIGNDKLDIIRPAQQVIDDDIVSAAEVLLDPAV